MKCLKSMAAVSALVMLVLFAMTATSWTVAEEKEGQAEIAKGPERAVPEADQFLAAFRIIFQAKTNGDYKTVRDSVPTLTAASEKLMKATLPAFYDDVKTQFGEQRGKLAETVKAFEAAAKLDDTTKLAEQVENVRKEFMAVLNLLSLTVKEVDSFHEILMPLWHEAVPKQDYAAIKAAMPELIVRTETVIKAQLPEKYKFLQKDFDEKRQALKVSIDELAKVCAANQDDQIEDKMIDMHEAYHSLVECLQ